MATVRIPQLLAVVLAASTAAHLVLGCCAHHRHVWPAPCQHHTNDGVVAAAACGQPNDDAPHAVRASGTVSRPGAGQPEGPEKPACGGAKCFFARLDRPTDVSCDRDGASSPAWAVGVGTGRCLRSSPLRPVAESHDLTVGTPRPHLLKQVLLI